MNIKIFLENTTTIDFAILDSKQGPIGKSLSVDVSFVGKTNAMGMLIDFSIAKKLVKEAASACDHRLIVSPKQIKYKTQSHAYVCQSSKIYKDGSNAFAIRAPLSWFCKISQNSVNQIYKKNYGALETLISNKIKSVLPKNIKKVQVFCKELKSDLAYTHTLCEHTGNCQRFHGHSSQIKVMQQNQFNAELTNTTIQKLNDLYVISKKYLKTNTDSPNLNSLQKYCFDQDAFSNITQHLYAFEYEGTDGSLALFIPKQKVLLLTSESTVENIAQYLAKIIQTPDTSVEVYEGFSKGACA